MLLVTGDEDGVAPPQQVRAFADKLHAAKSARVVVLPRCGHWTPIERPEECARELRDFLGATLRPSRYASSTGEARIDFPR